MLLATQGQDAPKDVASATEAVEAYCGRMGLRVQVRKSHKLSSSAVQRRALRKLAKRKGGGPHA
eukprot:10087768-Alexandrium_andersonii.AAC.1